MLPRLTLTASALAALAILTLTSCQGSSTPNVPATPTGARPEAGPAPQAAPIPAAVLDRDVASNGQGMLGLNQVTLDVANLTATIEPVRVANAIGDAFDVDIYEYLKGSPCTDCLKVEGLSYSGTGNVNVTFAAKHPFAFGPARYDLHVFDVRGTLIPVGLAADSSGIQSQIGTSLSEATGAFGILANAEGYSSFFTEQVAPYVAASGASGTIFPYRTMFKDLGPSTYTAGTGSFTDLQFPGGHNTMAMGESFDASATDFEIDVQGLGNQVQFLFLLDAAYGASATRPTRTSPKYFLPEFHRKEAFEAEMSVAGTLTAGGGSAFAQATVTARDWQGDQAPDALFGPDSSADQIKQASAVDSIEFFVPGVMSGPPAVQTNGVDFTGVVNPGDYWTTYETTFTFQNTAAAAEGSYWAVAAIRDSLYNTGSAFAVTREFTSGQPPQSLMDLTTYAVAEVIVSSPPGPTFTLIRNPIPADPVHHGDTVQFLIDSILPSVPFTVTAVEADPNWDGIAANFTPTVSCSMIDGDTYQTQYDYRDPAYLPTPGAPLTFAVRITDSNGGKTIHSESVTLTPNVGPTVAWTGTAPTTGSVNSAVSIQASHVNGVDTDGTVGTYRITWGDATPDYIGTLPASHTYTTVSTYTMTIYARDNGYGPGTTSPEPASAESTGATRNINITPGGLTAPWIEDFESTADGALPTDWVSYAPASVGSTLQFGVRSGTTAPSPTVGQLKILEESGFGQTTPGDRRYTANGTIAGAVQAARWGVFTPEIQIPNDANNWVVEVTHWYSYNYVTVSPPCGGSLGGDGSNIMTKSGAPGTLTATETGLVRHLPAEFPQNPPFYNSNAGLDGNFFLGLPGGWTSSSPMFGRSPGNTCPNAAGAYVVTRLNIPASYKGQAMRLYFWHGQQQNLGAWNGVGASFWSNTTTGYNGWRIDKVEIKAS